MIVYEGAVDVTDGGIQPIISFYLHLNLYFDILAN